MPGKPNNPIDGDSFTGRLIPATKKAQRSAQSAKAKAAESAAQAAPDPFRQRLATEMAKNGGGPHSPESELAPGSTDPADDLWGPEDELPDGLVPDDETPGLVPDDEHTQSAFGSGPVGTGEYVVKQGECISSIAKESGHFWETIWNDPANAELRGVRRDGHLLLPGDRVTVPPRRRRQEAGNSEMRHRFRRRGEPSWLRLVVKRNDVPRANEPYALEIGTTTYTGMTDGEGKLEQRIPADAKRGVLRIGADGETHVLQIGYMDPIESIVGVQKRLQNLGFHCGSADGKLGKRTRSAIRAFQLKHRLPVSGVPDSATRSTLVEQHGS